MSEAYITVVRNNLKSLREASGKTTEEVEKLLGVGPGWVDGIESGSVLPGIDVVASILAIYGKGLADLLPSTVQDNPSPTIRRDFHAESDGNDLLVHFRYAQHDATVRITDGTVAEFDAVMSTLRNGLAQLREGGARVHDADVEAIKTESVAQTFLAAAKKWPNANPSDLWWFVVYRAYCDPFNHPVDHARLDLSQSWKRTGGWALEEIAVRHYSAHLRAHGVNLFIASAEEKARVLSAVQLSDRLEADKVDVLLTGEHGGKSHFFGVVHVKASFAERRTDDVPLSKGLIDAGYFSPLWTMDCKGSPSATPVNRGELGETWDGSGADPRSAKRKDIEDDGYFSACFAYNSNTKPTPHSYAARSRVYVCDFKNPDDKFSDAVLAAWDSFRRKL